MEEGVKLKRKRNRAAGTKRWSEYQTLLLLTSVRDKAEIFEKPTAQHFYKKLQDEVKDLDEFQWDALKHKMRNLRTKYREAVDWRKNSGAGLMAENKGNSVRDCTLKICPYFDLLDDIFGSNQKYNRKLILDSENQRIFPDVKHLTESLDSFSEDPNISPAASAHYCEDILVKSSNDAAQIQHEQIPNELATEHNSSSESFKKPLKKITKQNASKNINSAINILADIKKKKALAQEAKQTTKLKIYKERIKLEKEINENRMEIQREQLDIERLRLNFEREKMNEEARIRVLEIEKDFELRKAELESREKLKVMEIEKESELKKFEIQLKYSQKQTEKLYSK